MTMSLTYYAMDSDPRWIYIRVKRPARQNARPLEVILAIRKYATGLPSAWKGGPRELRGKWQAGVEPLPRVSHNASESNATQLHIVRCENHLEGPDIFIQVGS
jgi:hypothetical protein